MKKYQMPNVEFVQFNAMQVIVVSPGPPPVEPVDGLAPRRSL